MITVDLTHPFKDVIPVSRLLVISIGGYVKWLADEAEIWATKLGHENDLRKETINTFKGDGLELLVEFLIKDGRISGISKNYAPVDIGDDCGVDGVGVSDKNLRPLTVQVKYKRNPTEVLATNKDHLSNFGFSSLCAYGVDVDDNENMVIITTGKCVNWKSITKMLHNRVRVINLKDLGKIVGDNDNPMPGIWDAYVAAIMANQVQKQPVPKIKLRDHQKKAVGDVMKAINDPDVDKGIIEYPTGTGKTMMQAAIIKEFIK